MIGKPAFNQRLFLNGESTVIQFESTGNQQLPIGQCPGR